MWHVVHVDFLLLLHVVGLQGVKPRGHSSFGTRASLTLTFPLLFLLLEFLRREGSLNEATVGFAVHVLVAGRTIQVPALMPLNLFQPHVLLATFRTATLTKTHGGLGVGRWFAHMVFGAVGFVTSLSKKVTMTLPTTSRGFETSRVSF